MSPLSPVELHHLLGEGDSKRSHESVRLYDEGGWTGLFYEQEVGASVLEGCGESYHLIEGEKEVDMGIKMCDIMLRSRWDCIRLASSICHPINA